MILLKCVDNKSQTDNLRINSLYLATHRYFEVYTPEGKVFDYFNIINCYREGGYLCERFQVLLDDSNNKLFKLLL